jgi:5'-deoxynucleotidase YfbR-like HD superfamily hydrolase
MNVEEKLKNHKDNIARLQLNLLGMENLEREIIEELCLPACVITDMPRSITNKFSSKTENAAMIKEILMEHQKSELMRQSKEICKIETVLKTLSKLDMCLVNLRYFEKCTWGLTAKLWAESAGIDYISRETLKKHKKRILRKLETLLGGSE